MSDPRTLRHPRPRSGPASPTRSGPGAKPNAGTSPISPTEQNEAARTSLWDSVHLLVTQAQEEEQARKQAWIDEEARRAVEKATRRDLEMRREQARAQFLDELEREKNVALAVERAKKEGRSKAETLAEAWAEPYRAELEQQKKAAKLQQVAVQERILRQKHRLKQILGAAVVLLSVGGLSVRGIYDRMQNRAAETLEELRAQAALVETQAFFQVEELKAQLEAATSLASAEQDRLVQALHRAEDEANAAHDQTLAVAPRKVAPKKLAHSPDEAAMARANETLKAPSISMPEQVPSTKMAYDFGMARGECDPHDPLCGNL